MTEEELLKLIPFYAAGTLETEEKIEVEQELSRSKKLQEELAFWRNARRATISYVEYLREGHPTAEALADYAERAFNGHRSQLIDEHLALCHNCKQEFEIISQTFEPSRIPGIKSIETDSRERFFASLYRFMKPVYIVPAMAVLVVLFLLLRPKPESENNGTILPYQQMLRGTEHPQQLHFSLTQYAASVDLTILIPHNSIPSVNYALFVRAPNRMIKQHPGAFSIAKGPQFDSLKASVAREFFPEDGLYEITVKELLPDSLQDITPAEYTYTLTISRF